MKKLLLTVVLGLFAITGFSRAKYDVHAGLSMANITNSEASMKAGFSVGLGIDCPINNLWAFQTGLNFTSKGCRESEQGVVVKMNPIYLDIPLLAAVKLSIKNDNVFVINAGPYVGLGLGGKMSLSGGGAEVSSSLFKKVEGEDEAMMNRCSAGLQIGIGMELKDKYLVNLSSQFGFTNMVKKDFALDNNKNIALMLTVGYRF